MATVILKKPRARRTAKIEAYHNESAQVDSTTTVMAACGGCHNLSEVHKHDRAEAKAGIGINLGRASASATVGKSGFAASIEVSGNGWVIGATATHNPWTGPHIQVSRSLKLSGGSASIASTYTDKTRVGR